MTRYERKRFDASQRDFELNEAKRQDLRRKYDQRELYWPSKEHGRIIYQDLTNELLDEIIIHMKYQKIKSPTASTLAMLELLKIEKKSRLSDHKTDE